MRLTKHKRGQFYMLTAVILITVLWGSLPQRSQETVIRSTFDELRANYILETPYVVNYALGNDENVTEVYGDFVERFLEYSKAKQVDFGVTYIIRTNQGIEVGNHIGEPIGVEVRGSYQNQDNGLVVVYPISDTIIITLANTTFPYTFNDEPVQFKALFRQIT